MTVGQWLSLVVLTAWRYDARGFYVDPRTRSEDELETRLWYCGSGLDPDRWREWRASDYEALPEEAPDLLRSGAEVTA